MDADAQFAIAAIMQYCNNRPRQSVEHWMLLARIASEDNGDNAVMALTVKYFRNTATLAVWSSGLVLEECCVAHSEAGAAAVQDCFGVLPGAGASGDAVR